MYVVKYIKYGSEEYQKVLKMRDEVIFKPLGRSVSDKDLSCGQSHIIIGAFESNSMFTNLLIGCGAIAAEDADTFSVQYVCVDKVLQKKGVGSALMQCLEKIACDRGAKKLVLDAGVSAVDFCQRFGYIPTGDVFEKADGTGAHIKMEKHILLMPKQEHHHHDGCGCGHHHG